MRNDGRDLEAFAAHIEGLHLPPGFTVSLDKKVYAHGMQLAQFDALIEGNVGTCNVRWLLECRDRPGGRKQGVPWIEQLNGRRTLHKFDKVIAVSATGFSKPAEHLAAELGIELRTVAKVTAEELAAWLPIKGMFLAVRHCTLEQFGMLICKETEEAPVRELQALIDHDLQSVRFKDAKGAIIDPHELYVGAIDNASAFVDSQMQGVGPSPVALERTYEEPNVLWIPVPSGDVRIKAVHFTGTVVIENTLLEAKGRRYKDQAGQQLSQTAEFVVNHPKVPFVLEVHKLEARGAPFMTIRRKPEAAPNKLKKPKKPKKPKKQKPSS